MKHMAQSFLISGAFALASHCNAANTVIDMLNNDGQDIMVFKPSVALVSPGSSVTFKSVDPGHQVKFISGPDPAYKKWSSALSEDYTITPTIPGTYVYVCEPHIMMGMIGILQVGSDKDYEGVKEAYDSLKPKIQMNHNRIEEHKKLHKDL